MGAVRPANWLGQHNPWNLPAPPAWWLKRLSDRDSELRILPGLTEPCYRVGRRSAAMQRVTPLYGNDSETGRMCRHGLVPVVTLRPDVTWNGDFFVWLDRCDTWARGGTDKFVNELEATERAQAVALDAASDDENDQRATSAYFAKLVREGAVAFLSNADQAAGQSVVVTAPGSGD